MALRLEISLTILFAICWTSSIGLAAAGAPLAGALPMTLYQLYGVAAATGWLAGNVYVARARGLPRALRRRLLLIYFLGPPSLLYLLRTLAPAAQQAGAPLAFVWAFGVFAVLFLVPVTLRRSAPRRR